jgi:PiT family inorganic phosphate transporter
MVNAIHSLPQADDTAQALVLIIAIVIFFAAELARVPLPLSMTLVGLLGGYALAQGQTSHLPYVAEVVALWFIAPVAAVAFAYYLIRYINNRPVADIWRRIRFYKALLIVLAFTAAYALGANTLGLIVATGGFNLATVLAAVGAIFVGSLFLGEGAIRRIGEEFYLMRYSNATVTLAASTVLVEVASFLNIPLSNTQATAAAVLGAGISYKTKFFSLRPFLIVIGGWIAAPTVSFLIGYFLLRL